jgi:thiol-disulfide isomerase/thioredoxin
MKKIIALSVIISMFFIYGLAAQTDETGKELANQGFQIPKKESFAPEVIVEDLKGKKFKFSENEGKILLFNQWATWCPPCKQEMPSIQRLSDKMKGKAFMVIGVSVGENKQTVADFLKQNKYTFPIFLDPTNKATEEYSTGSIPTTYLIGKKGKILGRIVGSREWDTPEFIALLEKLVKE